MKKIFISTLTMLSLSSCAMIFHGTKAKVTFDSETVEEPVTFTIDNKVKYENVNLPFMVKVKRGFKSNYVLAEAPGYEPYEFTIKKVSDPLIFLDAVGVVPWIVDVAAGAVSLPDRNKYMLDMKPLSDTQNEERVTRDNPGGTSLEGTVVRWFFDSEPRGARIFWRVVSNAPQEVKNTNELYLGTIPYEETRSFNIQGLTYENSHNVQIEIKVTKQGYEDQIKRFNVRQAIDQQEISGFFELVSKPE